MTQKTDYQNELGELAEEMANRVTGEMKSYGSGEHQMTIRVSEELAHRLDGAAKFFGVSRSRFVARLLDDAFQDFDARVRDHFRANEHHKKAVEYTSAVYSLTPEVDGK